MVEKDIFVPGRLCILGEHSDWAGEYRVSNPRISYGMTVVCATNEGLFARCSTFQANKILFECVDPTTDAVVSTEVALDVAELTASASSGTFFSYVMGTCAAVLSTLSPSTTTTILSSGLRINNYRTTLPMKKGLSSSAAVCVLVVEAFNAVFELNLKLAAVMELAYKGEMLTPSRCGRMDQCVAMGSGSVGLMEFDGSQCHLQLLACPAPLYFVVADLRAGKDTVCILQSLNDCFPIPADSNQSRMHRYVSNNQKLCWSAVTAIECGDVNRLGAAMEAAQQMFDDCAIDNCPSELTSPRLHQILADPSIKANSVAAKGVGSQGDGSVQVLCKDASQQQLVLDALTALGCHGFALTVPPTACSPERPLFHPHRVRSALVLVDSRAGLRYSFLGSATPPCLLPLPFSSGTMSCMLSLVTEMLACGVQRIGVVVCNARDATGQRESKEESSEEMADKFAASLQVSGVSGSQPHHSGGTDLDDLGPHTVDKPDRGAFRRRKSFTEPSSSWTYNQEQLEIIRGRVRFFFEEDGSSSSWTVLTQAVSTLHSAALKLAASSSNGGRGDGVGPLLVCRAESIPLFPKGCQPSDVCGLHSFLRESVAHSLSKSSTIGVPLAPVLAISPPIVRGSGYNPYKGLSSTVLKLVSRGAAPGPTDAGELPEFDCLRHPPHVFNVTAEGMGAATPMHGSDYGLHVFQGLALMPFQRVVDVTQVRLSETEAQLAAAAAAAAAVEAPPKLISASSFRGFSFVGGSSGSNSVPSSARVPAINTARHTEPRINRRFQMHPADQLVAEVLEYTPLLNRSLSNTPAAWPESMRVKPAVSAGPGASTRITPIESPTPAQESSLPLLSVGPDSEPAAANGHPHVAYDAVGVIVSSVHNVLNDESYRSAVSAICSL